MPIKLTIKKGKKRMIKKTRKHNIAKKSAKKPIMKPTMKPTMKPSKKVSLKQKRTRAQSQKGGVPPPPTKEMLLKDLGMWSSISCLPHNRGSVMVVENSKDTKGITMCKVFKIDDTIKPDKLYQYILFRDGETIQILITPGFEAPEVGTKHRCLLQRVPDNSSILASGELLKRDSTIFYSCMSSLFFQVMKKRLFPDRATWNEDIKRYEETTVGDFMREVVPYGDTVVYVKNIEASGFSKGIGDTEVYTEPYEKPSFNPGRFCDMPQDERPSCLRYVQKEDCEILQNHPEGGYCDAGLDFCSNLDLEMPPKMEIPEEAHVYDHKIDPVKSNVFLRERGIEPPSSNIMASARAKQIAKREGLTETQIKDAIYSKKKVWPK